ncbi:glutamate racemase [Marinilactibacillus sp. Marseille-P9653]|uniref:glutamate racemase n=1 Tax=Marinilactibacillus sp. Marseille-P9653 TaxID=2866583 RepID=UPI001CE3C238|nr:glutamate racemase [Marinilactibacillus sp. Marseille-P9653]
MIKQAIGLLDSGVGGLTVMKEAMKQLPNESFYYIGDTARCPYGPRPKEQVKEFTWDLTKFLLEKNIKMLIIACNTATAAALTDLKKELDIPVIGVILPGSRAAIKTTKLNRIGVIGTEGTIQSGEYKKAITKKQANTEVFSEACPKFVPLIESNQFSSSIAKKVVTESLQDLRRKKVDTLVLGCTHYPLLRPLIQNVIGDSVTLIDSGAETVNEVSVLLDYYDMAEEKSDYPNERKFYTTGSVNMFKDIASEWLELKDCTVEHISIKRLKGTKSKHDSR